MADPHSNHESAPRRKWQFSLRTLLLVILFLAIIGGLVSWWLRPRMLHPGYFPIGVGYRWVYISQIGDNEDEVKFEVVGTAKVGDAECLVVVRTIGDHQVKFYVEVTARGVFIHQVGDDRYTPPYRQFAFYSAQGDQWDWEGTIGGEPTRSQSANYGELPVDVPHGQWQAFVVNQIIDGNTTQFWLADGIGIVKLEAKGRDKHDPPAQPGETDRFDWHLKEFHRK